MGDLEFPFDLQFGDLSLSSDLSIPDLVKDLDLGTGDLLYLLIADLFDRILDHELETVGLDLVMGDLLDDLPTGDLLDLV